MMNKSVYILMAMLVIAIGAMATISIQQSSIVMAADARDTVPHGQFIDPRSSVSDPRNSISDPRN